MKKNRLFIAAFAAALFFCAPRSGTITETDSGIIGKVGYSTGTGAANATVQLFGARDTSRIALGTTETDQNGNYDFHKLAPGSYNVWAESNDSLLAFIDSVYVPEDSLVTANATLYKGGSVTAIVVLQPGHNPTSVFVQALGTQRYSNVNDSGRFTIKGLAQGEYTLRLVSTIPGYTPTYQSISVTSAVYDTLDTIYMVYSGIPIVTGLQAFYDEYTGIAKISWRNLTYNNFYEYRVYREPKGVVNPQPVLIAVSSDSAFVFDTLYLPKTPDSIYTADDTMLDPSVNYRYRVTMVNRLMEEGQKYEYADISGVDPAGLVTVINPISNERFKDSVGLSCLWSNVPSAVKYQVQISLRADFATRIFDTVTADTARQLPVLGINCYYVKIRCQSNSGTWGFWGVVKKFAVVGDLFATEIQGTDNLVLNDMRAIGNGGPLTPLVDGGFLIVCKTTTTSPTYNFIKTDSTGNEKWRLSYTEAEIGTCRRVTATPDYGMLILCSAVPNNTFIFKMLKISQTGSVLWRKEYSDSTGAMNLPELLSTRDNGFLLSYSVLQQTTRLGHVLICNSDGDALVNIFTDTSAGCSPLIQLDENDSIFVLSGKGPFTGLTTDTSRLFFNTYDFSGNCTSSKTLLNNSLQYITRFYLRNDGNFLVAGFEFNYSNQVYLLDKQLKIISSFFGGASYGAELTNSPDNDIFFRGFNGHADFLQKVTTTGEITWEKIPFAGVITPLSDGSVIAAEKFSDNGNITLYKISKNGLSFTN